MNEYNAKKMKLRAMDNRAVLYTGSVLLLLALAVIFALMYNARTVQVEDELDYPVAYSAISGSDAAASPSDVAQRADSYLAQFREFDRTYCFEYWMQCQNILAEHPDYAPDEALTAQARDDYRHYVLVVRTEREENRAFKEKLVVCSALVVLALAAGGLLGINRLRKFVLIHSDEDYESDDCSEHESGPSESRTDVSQSE